MADPARGLILLNRASQLLSKASSLDDLQGVRIAAEAASTFAKAAQLGLELQNQAAELKLRAERKAGFFLAELHLKGGDRRSKRHRVTLKLEDFGITSQQSTRWQLAASISDEEFERYVRGTNQLGWELAPDDDSVRLIVENLQQRDRRTTVQRHVRVAKSHPEHILASRDQELQAATARRRRTRAHRRAAMVVR